MKATGDGVLRIGAWRVDPALDEISKDGSTVKLERRAMQLLTYLAKRPGQVVSLEQLLNEVWAGVVVTQDSVYHAVASLRRVLGDDTREPVYIANVPRRGYRLIAPVQGWSDAPDATTQRASSTSTANSSSWIRRSVLVLGIALVLALGVGAQSPSRAGTSSLTDKSIAVLPFVDLSEKQDQEYFADGMAEEIISLLVTIPELRVIGRTSAFRFKEKSEDLRAIGSALGAAYVVEGTVRRSGEHLRVTAQLIDTREGALRWSQTYDRDAGDVLKVQGDIAASLVRALQLEVTTAIHLKAQSEPRSSEAYDFYLRGLHAYDYSDQRHTEEADANFRHALELDPAFAPAAAKLALALDAAADSHYGPSQVAFQKAREAAEAARTCTCDTTGTGRLPPRKWRPRWRSHRMTRTFWTRRPKSAWPWASGATPFVFWTRA